MRFVSLAFRICLTRSLPKRYLVEAVTVLEEQRAGLSFSHLRWDNSWAACPRRVTTSTLVVINSVLMPKSLSNAIAVAEFVVGSSCGDQLSFERHLVEPRFHGSLALQ